MPKKECPTCHHLETDEKPWWCDYHNIRIYKTLDELVDEEPGREIQTDCDDWEEKMYPCADCGKLRTKAEGGTTFTVCDACWDKKHS